MSQQPLFTPYTIGSLKLPQRVVMAPMTRNRAGPGQVPTALMAEYYAQRASAGLIITEATQASLQGHGSPNTPGIHTDAQVEGWRRVTDAVHARGGRIYLQVWHVGRISHPVMQPNGALPVAPSAIAAEGQLFTTEGPKSFVTPRALETGELPGIVREFAEGARRAKEAGFDGVEVHGANGYLLDPFLRDGSNHRTDAYGGSVEKRARLLLEVTEAMAAVLGADLRLRGGRARQAGAGVPARHGAGGGPPDAPAAAAAARALPRAADGQWRPLAPERQRRHPGRAGGPRVVSFGAPYLANPDLPERLLKGAALNPPDKVTFYGGDARGYTDSPALAA